MKQKLADGKMVRRYLLGELSEQEEIAFEEEYMSGDEAFDQLLVVEDELIDDYARNRLQKRERERFEARFLTSPTRRERVKSARALIVFADSEFEAMLPTQAETEPGSWFQRLQSRLRSYYPAMQFAFAAALLVMLFGGLWAIREIGRLRSQIETVTSEQATLREREQTLQQQVASQRASSDRLNQALEQERDRRGLLEQEVARLKEPLVVVASFELGPGFTGDVTTLSPGYRKRTLRLPRAADIVRLNIQLPEGDYELYRAELRTAEEREIWKQGMLKARRTKAGSAVMLRLPASLFTGGVYTMTISGTSDGSEYEPVREFRFNVIKR